MKRKALLAAGSACLAVGIGLGAGGTYLIERKNIKFAKDNSELMEVQQILADHKKDPPNGDPVGLAAAKAYMSQFDQFTSYIERDAPAEGESKEAVEDAKTFGDGILYAKINGFIGGTVQSYAQKIKPGIPDAKGLIIDLRDNGGGEISAAMDISNDFLSKGVVHCIIDNEDDYDDKMTDFGREFTLPVVILVNGGTASASEIMTALFMQNYGEVTVVGTQTYGKGIFQDVQRLSNGDYIRYTNGYYTVGDWECYNEIGITPDVVVEMDASLIGTPDDVQLQKAIDILG